MKRKEEIQTAAGFTNGYTVNESDFTWESNPDGITITGFFPARKNWQYCETLVIPETIEGKPVTGIGSSAFYSPPFALKRIELPDSVTTIGSFAFTGCSRLRSVLLSDRIISIGDYAFSDCVNLPGIELPASLKNMNGTCFCGCKSLKNILIDEQNPSLIATDNYIYTRDRSELIYCNDKESTFIQIPQGVMRIGRNAFFGCEKMVRIAIPDTVNQIGIGAFERCKSLKDIVLPEGVTRIDDFVFSECNSLTDFKTPANVTSIGQGAFSSCKSLASVEISPGVSSIDEYAFIFCSGLKRIVLPDSMKHIGHGAFIQCSALDEVKASEDILQKFFWKFMHTPWAKANGWMELWKDRNPSWKVKDDTLMLAGEGSTSEMYAFRHKGPWNRERIRQVEFFGKLTSIGACTFDGCIRLGEIRIPDQVKEIRERAFSRCRTLSRVILPERLEMIGDSAFSGCRKLSEITIPSGVSLIDSSAFKGCDSLTDLYYKGSEERWSRIKIGSHAFPPGIAIHFVQDAH